MCWVTLVHGAGGAEPWGARPARGWWHQAAPVASVRWAGCRSVLQGELSKVWVLLAELKP